MSKLKKMLIRFIRIDLETDEADDDEKFEELMQSIVLKYGATKTVEALTEVLKDSKFSDCWFSAADEIYYIMMTKVDIKIDRLELIAVLYLCLEELPQLGQEFMGQGENLVWSIASDLAGVGYQSDWQPLKDPKVLSKIDELRNSS